MRVVSSFTEGTTAIFVLSCTHRRYLHYDESEAAVQGSNILTEVPCAFCEPGYMVRGTLEKEVIDLMEQQLKLWWDIMGLTHEYEKVAAYNFGWTTAELAAAGYTYTFTPDGNLEKKGEHSWPLEN